MPRDWQLTRPAVLPAVEDPFDAVPAALDADAVELFRQATALYRLCSDSIAREEPIHRLLHASWGVTECVGEAGLDTTGRGLGLSDARMRQIADDLDAEARAAAGLLGG